MTEWMREQSRGIQALATFFIAIGLGLLVAVFIFGAFAVIDFIASLVTESGIQGTFALHHGLIGLVMFALGMTGAAYNREQRNYATLWAIIGIVGFLLMVNDIDDVPKWFLFVH